MSPYTVTLATIVASGADGLGTKIQRPAACWHGARVKFRVLAAGSHQRKLSIKVRRQSTVPVARWRLVPQWRWANRNRSLGKLQGKIYHNFLWRKIKTGIHHRGLDALAGFHGFAGKSHNRKSGALSATSTSTSTGMVSSPTLAMELILTNIIFSSRSVS